MLDLAMTAKLTSEITLMTHAVAASQSDNEELLNRLNSVMPATTRLLRRAFDSPKYPFVKVSSIYNLMLSGD